MFRLPSRRLLWGIGHNHLVAQSYALFRPMPTLIHCECRAGYSQGNILTFVTMTGSSSLTLWRDFLQEVSRAYDGTMSNCCLLVIAWCAAAILSQHHEDCTPSAIHWTWSLLFDKCDVNLILRSNQRNWSAFTAGTLKSLFTELVKLKLKKCLGF